MHFGTSLPPDLGELGAGHQKKGTIMLTPMLEKLVLSGQAEIKTHNHGVGGVGTIVVPPGKQIVITQILWHPFVDTRNSEDQERDVFFNSGAFVHTLKLRNKGKKYAFTFRDTFRCAVFGNFNGRGPKTVFYPEAATVIDTYLPSTEGNFDFDIMRFNDFRNWGVYSAVLPATTLEPQPQEGYGTLATTYNFNEVQNVNYYGFVTPPWNPPSYVPPTTNRVGFSNALANEFEADQPLIPPPNQFGFPPEGAPKDSDISMFPVVTFTYVLLNNRYVPGDTYASSGINPNPKK